MYDIIIVGAGPAGLSAAIYASRANKKVLVLEALTYGGQIISTNKIVNYPGFSEINGVDFAISLEEAKANRLTLWVTAKSNRFCNPIILVVIVPMGSVEYCMGCVLDARWST